MEIRAEILLKNCIAPLQNFFFSLLLDAVLPILIVISVTLYVNYFTNGVITAMIL
jgi:hypothetical protein